MTQEKIQALYDEWLQSGQNQREFLQCRQLKRSIFNNNYSVINTGARSKKNRQARSLRLLPVQVLERQPERVLEPQDLALQFSHGVCLRFSVGTSVEYVGSLANTLQQVRPC